MPLSWAGREEPARGTIPALWGLCAALGHLSTIDSNSQERHDDPTISVDRRRILVLGGGATLAYAAEENPALVREVQGMLIKRGYLKDYHQDWDQCSQRAAATFLSDQGKLKAAPDLSEIADELKKTPADARRTGEPVC